jgi:hypothetical protein
MNKIELEYKLSEMDHWFSNFLLKYSDKMNKHTNNLWFIYQTELNKYNELKLEYRFILLQG